MIPRYDHPEMAQLWADEHKYQCLLAAELAILEALEESGRIGPQTAALIRAKAQINPARITEIEKTVHHDIIAFCTSITEQFPTAVGKYFHFGVTSSDIIDTGLTLQIRDSLRLIFPVFQRLLQAVNHNIENTQELLAMGRSHGMYAEPMIFAQKWLVFYAELGRRWQELQDFWQQDLTCQFSGAVGNYSVLTPAIEELAASKLQLRVEPVSTQVIPRDRIAKLIGITSRLGSTMEKIAVEIRHLQRSEVNELSEGFARGQKGSSTMPHKKNPIAAENITGMARILKSQYQIALENNVLWHERDISHSSAERLFLPDTFGIVYYALGRLSSTLENLVYHPENIEKKVRDNPICLSSYYLHYLIEKLDRPRETLYYLVQEAAFALANNSHPNFATALQAVLTKEKIELPLPTLDFPQLKAMYRENFGKIWARTRQAYPVENFEFNP